MKFIHHSISKGLRYGLAAASLLLAVGTSAVTIPSQPLSIQPSAKPMIMLALGRDHRMFYEAYNDASDIDGDGTLDIRFKPSITYLGLFNSDYCYAHDGDGTGVSDIISKGFYPTGVASGSPKKCPGSWSGNWLNYITTSRIDALKVVLFGGTRDVDTPAKTTLKRTYIPQDAHSWAKEYTSQAVDGYLITDYTPLAQPNANQRHFFGNLTPNASVNCSTLSDCSDLPPWLSVVTNSSKRVWEWASTERPVLRDYGTGAGIHGGSRKNYTVRVEVCTGSYTLGCKLYPNGNYKPVGLLHDFGEDEAALFGLFSGSYDTHLSGGRLRKAMSSFKNEVKSNTGEFENIDGIVKNLNAFRIYGFNRGGTSQLYQGGVVGNRVVNQGEFPDWGNPVAELMYEATRYFANKGTPTAVFTGANTIDDIMGLSRPAWDQPYDGQGTSTAKAPYCARANLLTISDTNISFDSDQLPGVNSNFGTGISTDLSGNHIRDNVFANFNASTVANFISGNESGVSGQRFIGQSAGVFDTAPTAKTVGSLSSIRGLAPEEPTKQGSYYAAAVANFAKTYDLNSVLKDKQTVDNFLVGLASPLPRIEATLVVGTFSSSPPTPTFAGTMTLVPFAKSVGGAFSITATKGNYQPTNQIVDFYVESIVNSGVADRDLSINGGRYQATFRINYEDVEQGNDHDMDAIVVYTVRATADGKLDVTLRPIYQAGGVKHRMGYVLSGSSQDGIYLVVQDESESTSYFLNVPPGRTPGYCDVTSPPGDCVRLPYLGGSTTVTATASLSAATSSISHFTFSPGTNTTASFLKDPLYYAAKWGGFNEYNDNAKPDQQSEWDFDKDGQPDTYFYVQNPTKLKDSLTKAFRSIVERQGSSSNLATNESSRVNTDSLVYRASYVAGSWIGDVEAFPVTVNGIGSIPTWKAGEKLPAWDARNLLLQPSSGTPTNTLSLISMKTTGYSSLSAGDQTNFVSDDVYKYIRGDQSKETKVGGTLRDRKAILGDIIHSSPAYDLESNTLYLGSNSGFLHAFDGKTGVEKFALMPQTVVPKIKNLSNVGYTGSHEYFVDGENLLGYKFTETSNTYYLYSMLGRGGKGLFSINPGLSTTLPTMLWDYTAPSTSVGSSTSTVNPANDADLGLMLSSPFASLTNRDSGPKYAVFAGNGYNSTNGNAVLYIFFINANGTLDSIKKIDTGVGGDNGMSGPSGFDINADGKVDFVYAGDLKGNVWKFDVRDLSPDNWKLAFSGNVPMFKATDSLGNPQPITSAVTPVFNNYEGEHINKLYITFGTGSYFKVGDNTDLSVQTWYGIIDDQATFTGTSTAIVSGSTTRSALTNRSMSSPTAGVNSRVIRYASGDVTGDLAGKRGWYMDFVNPVNGERITVPIKYEPKAVKPALQGISFYPVNNDVCTPGGESYSNAVNPFTGSNLKEDFFLTTISGSNTVAVGPKANNPAPLSGAQDVNLNPSSLKLNVGIATSPINLGTGGSSSSADAWLTNVGITYGSSNTNIGRSDFERWNSRVAVKTERFRRDCAGTLISIVSGSEGIESNSIKGCETNRIQGRISWREILKD